MKATELLLRVFAMMFRALFLAFAVASAVAGEAGSLNCSEDAPGQCIEDIPANVNLLQVHHSLKNMQISEELPRFIITGMERSGTTMVNAYMQNIPGVFGSFETGFLLAESPATFYNVHPFYEWSLGAKNAGDCPNPPAYWSFNLTEANRAELLKVNTHAKMYSYVKEHSPLFAGAVPTKWLVDKTPMYVYDLPSVMERAPGVPVLVLQRDADEVKDSWRRMSESKNSSFNEEEFKHSRKQAEASIQAAVKKYPERVHVIDYSLFKTKKGAQRSMRAACEHVGLKWEDEYLDLQKLSAKFQGLNYTGPTSETDQVLAGQRKYWK